MSLFWYPDKGIYDFDKPIDKPIALNAYITYFLDRLQSMFKYSGLPDSIPQKWLEHYLLCNGHCAFVLDGDDLIVTTGGWGGLPDRYYIPTQYIVSNPYVKQETRKTYTVGEDCVVMRNDVYCIGVLPLLNRYCSQLVENDITLNVTDILCRAMLTITAANGKDKESVDTWLGNLRKGKISSIGELPSIVGNQDRNINITPFREVASCLTDLIEYHQYLKAGLYNDLGLNSNYNMKRESINSNESQLNDDMLHPLIDTMLAMRREGLNEVNDMFGTNITVEFDSSWKDNEIENKVMIDSIIDSSIDRVKETPEETPEEITDAINELTDAINELTDNIEGDENG